MIAQQSFVLLVCFPRSRSTDKNLKWFEMCFLKYYFFFTEIIRENLLHRSRRIISYFKNNLSEPENFSQVVLSLKRKRRIVICEEIPIQNLQDFIIKI